MSELIIRDLDPNSKGDIDVVATRMGLTLVDVLGKERGQSLYSYEELKQRLQDHIDMGDRAKILLAGLKGEILGHAIARVEKDEHQKDYLFFSTIYIQPEVRQKGFASQLVLAIEQWGSSLQLPTIIYNTAHNNQPTIRLFESFGFKKTLEDNDMVQLKKTIKI